MGMSSLMVPCRCSRHYQRLQEILHSSFILFCFPSLYCSESSKEGGKKSQNTFFIYLPISFPPQNAHSRTIFYDTAISTHNFYLSSLSSTLHQAVLQGQQEAGVLFWKQWLWYRGSYNSWISCCLFFSHPHPAFRKPIKVHCRYSRRLRPYSRQTTTTWIWSGTVRKRYPSNNFIHL